MLEHIILGFLMESNMTGYEIKQMMMVSTSNFIDASFGSIYPALKRLESGGSISFTENVMGGKYKKLYSITEKGKEELLKWLREPTVFSPFNYEYLAKLFFYKHLEKEETLRLIQEFTVSVNVQLEKLENLENDCKPCMGFFDYATLRFGKECYSMIIEWHKKLMQDIENTDTDFIIKN